MDMALFGRLAALLLKITNWLIINSKTKRGLREEVNRLASIVDYPNFCDERYPMPDNLLALNTFVAAIVYRVLDPMLSGETPVPIQTAIRRAEFYWARLHCQQFWEGQTIGYATVPEEFRVRQQVNRSILGSKSLYVWKAHDINPDDYGDDPIQHNQHLLIARIIEGEPFVYACDEGNWINEKQFVAKHPDADYGDNWWSGFWFKGA